MNAEELGRLRVLADAASAGPWRQNPDGSISDARSWEVIPRATVAKRDREFIAAARAAVPALLDEVDRLTEALEAAERDPGETVLREIEERRTDEAFMDRIRSRVAEDADLLQRIGDDELLIADLRARVSHAEAQRDEQIAKVLRLDAEFQTLAEQSREDAARLADIEAVGNRAINAEAAARAREATDRAERAEADLADEKRRRAELRAGVEALVDAWEGSHAVGGNLAASLRALLDTATEEPT